MSIRCLIDRREVPFAVLLDNPDGACSWSKQDQVIQLASASIVKGEGSVGGNR
jgi:hypothetical protein